MQYKISQIMNIYLASDTSMGTLQAQFNSFFPNLKLAFFSKPHDDFKSSAAKFLIQEKDKYTSEQITAKINELTESISKKEVPLDEQFKDAQVAFAKKYNFTLRKNDLEEKFKDAKEE